MRACSRNACDAASYRAGLCSTHWLGQRRQGLAGYVPAGPALDHVRTLLALGWSCGDIDTAAGLGHNTTALAVRAASRLRAATARKILALPTTPRVSRWQGVDVTGTRRRLQALAWMGWSAREVSARCGLAPTTLSARMWAGTVSTDTAARVARVYDDLSLLEGPSKLARVQARSRRWAPPLAWDESTIDDPQARPRGVRAVAA